MELEFSRHIFEKYSNIEFNENPSSGSRIALRVREGGRTDMKLIVAFRNFSKATKNWRNDNGSRKRKYSEKSLPQCHSVYHKSHLAVRKWHRDVFTSEFPGFAAYSCFICIWNRSFKRPTNPSFLQVNYNSVLEIRRSLCTLQF